MATPFASPDGSKFVDDPFTLRLGQKDRWGYVIYRTNYSSEEDWDKFVVMFKTWTVEACPPEKWEVGRRTRAWQQMWWINDKTKFENASMETLRSHFTSWLASQDLKHGKQMWPEHYMFLVVDREVLDNIHDQDPENSSEVRDQEPFIKAFDSDASGDGLDYPGWMKVELTSFYALYAQGMQQESMRGLRSRYSEWFDEDAFEEDTYAAEQTEPEASRKNVNGILAYNTIATTS